MKFLIIPGNNSLSHGIKSIAIQNRLLSNGHESIVAVSPARASFYKKNNVSYTSLRDIQEIDGSSFPTINWFRDREKIIECIKSEVSLIQENKPDRVLGVFRFTLKASAELCGIPLDSLICGCMLPENFSAPGFHAGIPEYALHEESINMFFKAAGRKMSKAISTLGLAAIGDIREMFVGDRTFLWDIPEFMPLSKENDSLHVGPLFWNEWADDAVDIESITEDSRPLAVVAFGTCNTNTSLLIRLINILCDSGYKVIVAAGGQENLFSVLKNDSRINSYLFLPLGKILPYATLVVCHGGQMTIFESLTHEVPVAVVPFHPEQAHNGACLERIGCGRMLIPACRFIGNSAVYADAFSRIDDVKLKSMIVELVENPDTKKNLKNFKNIMARYKGLETITNQLGE